MKKLLALLVFCSLSVNTFAATFSDVKVGDAHYNAIMYLAEKEVVVGYKDGSFRPGKEVSRAEATKMVLKALGIRYSGAYTKSFSDVKANDWFHEYVMVAGSMGTVNGYADGTFKPHAAVNLAENLRILLTAAKVDLKDPSEAVFGDVAAEAWYSPYFQYAKDFSLIDVNDQALVKPGETVTRARFAEAVYRLMISKESGKPFPLELNWQYKESASLPFKMKVDPSWEKEEGANFTLFGKRDSSLKQFDLRKIYPNSAFIEVKIDKNVAGLSKADYFASLRAAFDAQFKDFKIGEVDGLEALYSKDRAVDWYLYMPNGQVLMVYTKYGDGNLGFQLKSQIAASLRSLTFVEAKKPQIGEQNIQSPISVTSQMLALVLVEGKGENALALVNDEEIVETDSLGVGTGPIDYYYSAAMDYTLKYERDSKTVLAAKKGRLTNF